LTLQFSGTREMCDHFCLNVNILRKTAVLHLTLTLFCSWGCAKLRLYLTFPQASHTPLSTLARYNMYNNVPIDVQLLNMVLLWCHSLWFKCDHSKIQVLPR
jgi:hypothetical protein